MTDVNDNMKLWKSVETTDPDMTRRVDQRGGFTAIDAQAQIMRATELWGPYGYGWGLSRMEFETIYENGKPVEVAMTAMFFYPPPEDSHGDAVYFPIAVDKAWRAGDDNRKKLQTDATTKALSKLGFNADVFLGKFDSQLYVQRLKEAKQNANAPKATRETVQKIKALSEAVHGPDAEAYTTEVLQSARVDRFENLPAALAEKWLAKLTADAEKGTA